MNRVFSTRPQQAPKRLDHFDPIAFQENQAWGNLLKVSAHRLVRLYDSWVEHPC